MKIRVASDLHLEFGHLDMPALEQDVVVFAGDIHVGLRAIPWIQNQFHKDMPVLYVLGNHEYYGKAMPKLVEDLREETKGTNIHVLECGAFVHKGVRFLGATMWTDFALHGATQHAMWAAEEHMSDYSKIRISPHYKKFRPLNALWKHTESLAWLESKFAEPFEGPTVVVSHHAPHELSLIQRKAPGMYSWPTTNLDKLDPCYASNLDKQILQWKPKLWIHGHTHHRSDYVVGDTRVVCNPRGYAGERGGLVEGFDPGLILEI